MDNLRKILPLIRFNVGVKSMDLSDMNRVGPRGSKGLTGAVSTDLEEEYKSKTNYEKIKYIIEKDVIFEVVISLKDDGSEKIFEEVREIIDNFQTTVEQKGYLDYSPKPKAYKQIKGEYKDVKYSIEENNKKIKAEIAEISECHLAQ